MKIDFELAADYARDLTNKLRDADLMETSDIPVDYDGLKKAWQRLNAALWPLVEGENK